MRLSTIGFSLALSCVCLVLLAGCGADNEGAIKEQAARARETIPGARSAQPRTQAEYARITFGVQTGVGVHKGASYPGTKK